MPTRLISKHIQEFASNLRNQTDYDDFAYGTEPIPGDKTWVKKQPKSAKLRTKHQLLTHP